MPASEPLTEHEPGTAFPVLSVSVPPEAAEEFNRLAGAEGRNKSELFREMLRVYRTYRESGTFESLQRYGAARYAGWESVTRAMSRG